MEKGKKVEILFSIFLVNPIYIKLLYELLFVYLFTASKLDNIQTRLIIFIIEYKEIQNNIILQE